MINIEQYDINQDEIKKEMDNIQKKSKKARVAKKLKENKNSKKRKNRRR